MRTLPVLVASLSATAAAAQHRSPEEAVRAYFAGGDQCQSSALESAFHPAAHLFFVDEAGAPQSLAQLTWWQRTDGAKPCAPALERHMKILDREGPLALFEATSRFPTFTFHDYLLVAELPSGWRIVDKVFEKLAPDPPPGTDESAALRKVLADAAGALASGDRAALATTHLADAVTTYLPLRRETLSEIAASGRRENLGGPTLVASGRTIAAARVGNIRYVVLVRTKAGWKVAAALTKT